MTRRGLPKEKHTVDRVDHCRHPVHPRDRGGGIVKWQPWRVAAGRAAGKYAGCEVYRSQGLKLRAGDRVRVTRNDKRTGLVNGQMAHVAGIEEDRVRFEVEDGGTIAMREGDPQLRFLDHAWAPTIHAFQGRTVDTVIAALESRNPAVGARARLPGQTVIRRIGPKPTEVSVFAGYRRQNSAAAWS